MKSDPWIIEAKRFLIRLIPANRELRIQLTRFIVIGLTSVAIDLLVYRLLVSAGVMTDVAKGLSYLCGMTIGYFGNKFWSFRSSQPARRETLSFVMLYFTTLMLNVLINRNLLRIWGDDQHLIAYVIATGVSTVLNFWGLKRVTFRQGIRARLAEQSQDQADTPPTLHHGCNTMKID